MNKRQIKKRDKVVSKIENENLSMVLRTNGDGTIAFELSENKKEKESNIKEIFEMVGLKCDFKNGYKHEF